MYWGAKNFGRHFFPCQSLLLSTSVLNDKNLAQKMHFIKNLHWFNKGCNLAILTPICKNWASSYSLSREEFKNLWVDLIFQCFRPPRAIVCKRVKMAFYYAILATFWQFFVVILNIFNKPNIYLESPFHVIEWSLSHLRILKYP